MVSGIGTFAVALALYWPTLVPGVAFWDTAEYQTVGPVLGIAHPTGFPSYVLLTWAANIVLSPFGDTAFRLNLFSAILVAGAAGLLAATIDRLTGRPIPAVAGGLLLATAQIAWWTAQRADSHALHVFLAMLLLFLLVSWARRVREADPFGDGIPDRMADRLLVAAAGVYAVALGNHGLTVLLAPGILLFLLAVQPRLFLRRMRLVATCAAVIVVVTAVLYAYIPIRASMNPPLDYARPTTLGRFAYLVLGLQFGGLLQDPLAGGLAPIVDLFGQQLGPAYLGPLAGSPLEAVLPGAILVIALLAFAAALVGLPRLGSVATPVALLTGTWFVIVTLFARGYNDGFPDRYYLVPIAVVALWAAVGVAEAWSALGGLPARARSAVARLRPVGAGRTRPAGPVLWMAATALLTILVLAVPVQRAMAGSTLYDASGEDQAARWLDAAYAILPRDAVVVSWWSYSTTLWYGRWVEGRRPDITIVDDRNLLDDGYMTADAAIRHFEALGRPVYLIRQDADIPALAARYRLVAHATIPGLSPIWEVVP